MNNKGKVLIILGGGIGNIVQATPAIQAIASEKWTVDLKLECNSSRDVFEIFKLGDNPLNRVSSQKILVVIHIMIVMIDAVCAVIRASPVQHMISADIYLALERLVELPLVIDFPIHIWQII